MEPLTYPRPVSAVDCPWSPKTARTRVPSGTFLASSFLSGKRAGQGGCGVGRVVLPMSTFRGVGVEAEQLEQALLGWVGVGEDALGAGPAFVPGGVEKHGLFDAAQGGE